MRVGPPRSDSFVSLTVRNVFEILRPGKTIADPLQSPRAAGSWLHDLPRLDVIERERLVVEAFADMRRMHKPVDLPRVHAISFLDAALGADRRQLIKQYVEHCESSPQLADRVWQATNELTQAFTFGYRKALEQAIEQRAVARWRPVLPMLFARLVHYYGTEAKLRVFRFERWIPAKWRELHELYRKSLELGVERIPTSLMNSGASTMQWTVEQEFISVLLIHQLNAGNLTPAELDWASAQLRAWGRRLVLDSAPRGNDGFFVDLSGKGGLVRRTGHEGGAMLRFLDTTPLVEHLDRAIVALRRAENAEISEATVINEQRIGILERLRPSIAPNLNAELRRDPRTPVDISARVRVGLARICRELMGQEESGDTHAESAEHIEVFAVNDGSRPRKQVQEERDSMLVSLGYSDPSWLVKDRSVAGLRIAASGGIGQSLALGALVAVRQSDIGDWVLGVVRRVNKLSKDEIEAGLSIVTDRLVPVALHNRRDAGAELGMEVDGLDASTTGARFDGLYLPPPSRPDKPLHVKTLIVPTAEYVEGRKIILVTGRSIYTVALRTPIEQRPDWTWAAIQIVEKKPRPG